MHPQETNNKASKCVKVKRKSSSLNKGAKKLDFHYPTVSLKSPNSSQKNPTLPPRGGNNLFENVFLPSNLDTEKALLHQPNSSHQAIPRCDSGCYPDCDISLSSLKTEELDFRITEAESLRTKENNEVINFLFLSFAISYGCKLLETFKYRMESMEHFKKNCETEKLLSKTKQKHNCRFSFAFYYNKRWTRETAFTQKKSAKY